MAEHRVVASTAAVRFRSSTPYTLLAQMAEQQTFNLWGPSSNLGGRTNEISMCHQRDFLYGGTFCTDYWTFKLVFYIHPQRGK